MWCKTINIYIFLWISQIKYEVFSEILDEIDKQVQVEDTDIKHVKKVRIFNEINYQIILEQNYDQNIDKVNVFSSVINCLFCEWVVNHIDEFIKQSPLYFQHKFFNTRYAKTLNIKSKQTITTLNEFESKITDFMNILYDTSKTNRKFLHHNDKTIFIPLLSLKTKIVYILLSNNESKKLEKFIKSDNVIIRELLKDIIKIKQYLHKECVTEIFKKQNSQFSVIPDKDESLNILLSKIGVPEIYPKIFSINQMLLKNIVTTSSNHSIVLEILGGKFKPTQIETVSIKDIHERAQQSYDIEVIYMYQNAIITSIMKSVTCYLLNFLNGTNNSFPDNISDLIFQINRKIYQNNTDLPSILIEGFTIFREVVINTDANKLSTFKSLLLDFHDSMNTIQLDCTVRNTRGVFTSMDVQRFQDSIAIINDNFDDFTYFGASFIHLKNHYDKYYVPFLLNGNKLTATWTEYSANRRVCDFFIYMQINLYSAKVYTNRGIEKEGDNAQQQTFLKFTWSVVSYVLNHFVLMNKHFNNDPSLLKVVRDVITILKNQNQPSNVVHLHHLNRVIKSIVLSLDDYGIQYCTLPRYNYLLSSNIDFNEMKNSSARTMYGNLVAYLPDGNVDFSQINEQDYACYDFKDVYTKFFENCSVFKKFQNRIKFNWEGKELTAQQIYETTSYSFSNAHHLYALYDIFFKFHIAAIYAGTQSLYTHFRSERITKPNESDCIFISYTKFPWEFHYLIKCVNRLICDILRDPQFNDDKFALQCKNIENKLKNFNMTFNFNDVKFKELNLKRKSRSEFQSTLEEIFKEIPKLTNKVFECYLKIRNIDG